MKSIGDMAHNIHPTEDYEPRAERAILALAYVLWENTNPGFRHAPNNHKIRKYVAETISGFRVNRDKSLLKKELKRVSDLDVMRLLLEYGLVEHTDCLERRNERPISLHGEGYVAKEIASDYLRSDIINQMFPSYPRYSPVNLLPNPEFLH